DLRGGVAWPTVKTNTTFQNSYNGIYGQFGIALPLFNSSFNNRKKALETKTQIAENNLDFEKLKLQNQYQNFLQEYQKNKMTIDYYENKALKSVDIVTQAANDKFNNGDINYLEWVMLINQNTEIRSNYIEAVKRLNNSIIVLNSLTKTE
ncbi:TolC family protein, partial [Flavobacterium sp.]|uniref:TolC family protein n=1 Tax=Flavobacterium sp. TaxID=239 RepID=UPI00262FC6A3